MAIKAKRGRKREQLALCIAQECERNCTANSTRGTVTDSEEGVCVDPGEKGAILETGGPGPPERGKGWQLAPDSGGEGTNNMATGAGDGLATASRDGYAQSECYCALYSSYIV